MIKSLIGEPVIEPKKRKKVLATIGDELLVGEKGGGGEGDPREA